MIRDVADTVQIPNTGPAALMVLAALAQTRPGDVIHYEHEVQCAIEDLPLGGDAGMGVLVPLSTLGEVSFYICFNLFNKSSISGACKTIH